MATADPDCDISWTLLAAIGRVETNHGRFGGAQLGSDGVSRPEIRGPQLDGAGTVRGHPRLRQRRAGPGQGLGPGRGPDAVPPPDLALGGARRRRRRHQEPRRHRRQRTRLRRLPLRRRWQPGQPRRHGPRGLPLQPLRLLRLAGAVDAGRLRDRCLRTALAAAPGQGEGRQGQDPEDEAHPAARRHQGQVEEPSTKPDEARREADLHPEAEAEARASPSRSPSPAPPRRPHPS